MSERPRERHITMREVIASAVRVGMTHLNLDQAQLAKRMVALGVEWKRQTVGYILRGERRVAAEELLPLSLALECAMADLLAPGGAAHRGALVDLPNGKAVPAIDVSASAGIGDPATVVSWDGDRLRVAYDAHLAVRASRADRERMAERRERRRRAELARPAVMTEDELQAFLQENLPRLLAEAIMRDMPGERFAELEEAESAMARALAEAPDEYRREILQIIDGSELVNDRGQSFGRLRVSFTPPAQATDSKGDDE